MQRQLRYSLFLIILLTSCGKPLPTLEGIDMIAWKEDKNGCLNNRSQSIQILEQQKEKLKALDEMGIVKILGRPDQNELYKRNQKFFYYFLEPGVVCGIDKKPKRLSVRFNAVGRAKEVIIE
jgi:hypothetical protein